MRFCIALLLLLIFSGWTAIGRTLQVGPQRALKLASDAAAEARDGDTIVVDAGKYDDCAVWRANRLTIIGAGTGAVFLGKTCEGKAIFVVSGQDMHIQNVTFEHAAVPAHNGAGIRAEGGDLLVENCRFIDNEEGILSGPMPGVTIAIVSSEFNGNGNCIAACAHGIYAGKVGLLRVENSRFINTHQGHHVKSRALHTIIRGNTIEDGPEGNSSYLIDIPNGGDLLIERNALVKGPHTDNPAAAISLGAEGVSNPTRSLQIRNNTFANKMPVATVFVRNRTEAPAELIGNRFEGMVVPLEGKGTER
ncbi:MAG: hypothetical protein JO227_21695 [Acetobacteraceae bacterium]|nr:hypothetical protein [Acetobacteraceae bacterium]